METCQICFQDYLEENTKDHQCPDNFCCGACGEIVDHEEGQWITTEGFPEFVHKAELCSAQDETETNCDLCQTTEKLLTESDKATLRPNWAGVDFYNAICIPCWNSQKDNN